MINSISYGASLTAGNFVSLVSRREPTTPIDVPATPANHGNLAFESAKTRHWHHYSNADERNVLSLLEADPKVVTFVTEPPPVEFACGYFLKRHQAFAVCLNQNGTVDVLDIRSGGAAGDLTPEELKTLSDAYTSLGATLLDATHLSSEPRVSTCRTIAADRSSPVTARDKSRLVDAIEDNGGTISYGEAVAVLSRDQNPYDPAARACLHALIVRRLVSLDIDSPIDLFTPLDLAEPLADAPSSYFLFAEQCDA